MAGGAFALVAKDPNDTEAMERAKRYFEFLSRDPAMGIHKLYSREELNKMGSFPDAFLAGDTAEGFTVGGNSDGALVTPTNTKGMHGYDPDNPKMKASFLVSGAGTTQCRSLLANVQILDVAPTAAALLGITFPSERRPRPG